MKQKDIEKCRHINLSTGPEDIVQTMAHELPVADYFFHKEYGGNNRFEKYKEKALDTALIEEQSQYSDFSEYISHKGNRWISYVFTEYYPKAKYALSYPTSFIYYETYGSCGAFFPMFDHDLRNRLQDGQKRRKPRVIGSYIFTSHFFQRMSERTGKAFRSRELVREFITTMQTQSWQVDDDGEIIIRFKGGYGFGVKRCDNPLTAEVRTFLADEQLTPAQRRKCERVDAFAELVKDGAYLDDVALHTAYHNDMTPEEQMREANRKLLLCRKIGDDRPMLLAGWVNTLFMMVLGDLLHIGPEQLNAHATVSAVGLLTKEVCAEFVKKYLYYDGSKATDEERRQLRTDLADTMEKCARKLKLQSITRERVYERIEQYALLVDQFAGAYEALDKGLKEEEKKKRRRKN